MQFGILLIANKLAKVIRKILFDEFSSISDILISILNDNGTFPNHLTFLTFPVENMFNRLSDQLIGVLWMFLGEDLLEFLK